MQSLLQRLLLGNAGGGGGGNPTLNYNFVDGSAFPSDITFTRASTATFFNSSGVLTSAGNDVPRLDYDPATLAAQGLLIEEQRTNSIRNSTMQGAVAGTPGTLPTNWGVSGLGTLTQQVVGTGTVNGITYIDLRFSGTTSTTQLTIRHEPTGTGGVAAANGQSWAQSAWTAVVAGSTANITQVGLNANIFDSGGAFLAGIPYTNFIANTTSTLTRVTPSGTIATVGTAFITPQIYLTFSSGAAIDITLRIGLPQLEQGAFATSVIPTTTTALTRNADVATVNTLSPWFNASAGTTYFEGVTFDSLAAAFPRVYQFNDGTNNNVIQITRNNGSGAARMSVVSGGVAQAAADATAWTLNATTKAALAYATNDFAIVANGGAATTDTSGTVPTVTNLLLGSSVGNIAQLNGYLRRLTYYPVRLTNAALQQITT